MTLPRVTVLACLLLASPALAQRGEGRGDGHGGGGPSGAYAEPSDIIATEIAFARMAQDKGQWTAFTGFAAPNGQMFASAGPGKADVPVRAEAYLKRKPNPAQPIKWQPQAAWMACDGSVGVTFGAWQAPAGGQGWFATVWQRQKKGEYRFVLDQGDSLAAPLPAPEWIEAKVADCPPRSNLAKRETTAKHEAPPTPAPDSKTIPDYLTGHARDATLEWRTVLAANGARSFTVAIKLNGELRNVLTRTVAAP